MRKLHLPSSQSSFSDDLSPRRPLYQAKLHPSDARDLTRSRPKRIQNLGLGGQVRVSAIVPHCQCVINMFYVYVLRSGKTGRRYVGCCEDLGDRLRRHNAGESKATKHGIPWTLLYAENFVTRSAAMARERYYKTGRGRDELNRLL